MLRNCSTLKECESLAYDIAKLGGWGGGKHWSPWLPTPMDILGKARDCLRWSSNTFTAFDDYGFVIVDGVVYLDMDKINER